MGILVALSILVALRSQERLVRGRSRHLPAKRPSESAKDKVARSKLGPSGQEHCFDSLNQRDRMERCGGEAPSQEQKPIFPGSRAARCPAAKDSTQAKDVSRPTMVDELLRDHCSTLFAHLILF